MKEMRKRKHCPLTYVCRVERKEEWGAEIGKHSLYVMCVCLFGAMLARMPAYCMCACMWTRGCICVRQTSSCSGGRLFLQIVWTSIGDKQVRAGKSTKSNRGTLAFVCASPWHKAVAIRHDESVKWWNGKRKSNLQIQSSQTGTHAWGSQVQIVVVSNWPRLPSPFVYTHTSQHTPLTSPLLASFYPFIVQGLKQHPTMSHTRM